MIYRFIPLVFVVMTFGVTAADSDQAKQLVRSIQDYARCTDAVGYLESDEKKEAAIQAFYKSMLENVYRIIDLQTGNENAEFEFWIKTLGRDVFAGFLLRSASEDEASYKKEKKQLMKDHDYQWKMVQKAIWEKYGCSTIYELIQDK